MTCWDNDSTFGVPTTWRFLRAIFETLQSEDCCAMREGITLISAGAAGVSLRGQRSHAAITPLTAPAGRPAAAQRAMWRAQSPDRSQQQRTAPADTRSWHGVSHGRIR